MDRVGDGREDELRLSKRIADSSTTAIVTFTLYIGLLQLVTSRLEDVFCTWKAETSQTK